MQVVAPLALQQGQARLPYLQIDAACEVPLNLAVFASSDFSWSRDLNGR
jgi:hypothetical protein